MHSRELPFLMVAAPQPSSPGMLSPMRLGKSVCLPPIWVRAASQFPTPPIYGSFRPQSPPGIAIGDPRITKR
jgi:hypothetical protein